MKRKKNKSAEMLDRFLDRFGNPPQHAMEASRERLLERLRSGVPVVTDFPAIEPPDVSEERPHLRNVLIAAAVVASLIVAFSAVLLDTPGAPGKSEATVKFSDGALSIVSGKEIRAVRVNDTVRDGQAIRSSGGAVLLLVDGSRVEMRAQSELALERAADGIRVRLSRGGVIVNAAKQGAGHLYVQTKDVTVSVLGTVFLVNAEEEGSRVAVIQGEVQVQQGGASKKLLPGEQVSSNPIMPSVPVIEELSWSRNAAEHLALLQQSLALLHATVIAPPLPQIPGETRETFEVVSIRPSAPASSGGPGARGSPGGRGGGPTPGPCVNGPIQIDPRRFSVSGISLHRLITLAYGKNCRAATEVPLISGGPAWMRSELFDVQATIPEGSPSYILRDLNNGAAPKLQMMLQTMLADRFKLVFHRETREARIYNLVVVRMGKIKISDDQTPPPPPPALPPPERLRELVARGLLRPTPDVRGSFSFYVNPAEGKVTIKANAVPISTLINVFQGQEGWVVVDKTELNGLIDIPEQTLDVGPFELGGPSVWPEIVAQLGMKLEPAKGPVEVFVIDRAEKPTEN